MRCLAMTVTDVVGGRAVQADLESSIRSGSGSENAPLVRWPGSLTDSVASAAVEMTVAVVDAV